MCTVTYIPGSDSFLLASNRDENRDRPAALPPAMHKLFGQRVLFPRDPLAGGSWIAAGENGYALVLLNGAFEKHVPNPPYRKSRGVVLLELTSAPDPESAFAAAGFEAIEPFTLIIAGHGKLAVGRWDGTRAELERPYPACPHIWSSVTLYPEQIRTKRAGWFHRWLQQNPAPDVPALFDFHRFTGDGDPENDLQMKRSNGIFTNSISVLDCRPGGISFYYADLRDNSTSMEKISFTASSFSRR